MELEFMTCCGGGPCGETPGDTPGEIWLRCSVTDVGGMGPRGLLGGGCRCAMWTLFGLESCMGPVWGLRMLWFRGLGGGIAGVTWDLVPEKGGYYYRITRQYVV